MTQHLFGNQLVTLVAIFAGTIACAIAVFTDLRERRIPNWLVLTTLIAALVIAAAGGLVSLGSCVLVIIGMLLFGVLVHASGILGGGDAKLLVAISALAGFPGCIEFLLYTAIAGGVLAIGVSIAQRRLVEVCTGTFHTVLNSWTSRRFVVIQNDGDETRRPLPYALAIAAGFAVLVLSLTYFPALRLPL